MFKKITTAVTLCACLLSSAAQAHFQMLYTPDLSKIRGGSLTLKMPFAHPAANGHVMKVEKPEAFFQFKKGKQKNLLDNVVLSQWTSAKNTEIAYEAEVSLRGLGDNIFVLQMAPYFEETENIYIQQITKTIVNVAGLPTDWQKDLGLDAEIVPLTKPYAIYEGGTFTGVVKRRGNVVPFAEIEVEFVNYVPNMQTNSFSLNPVIVPPSNAFITMTLFADANGTFTFGIPKAGQWGFAAIGVGAVTEYLGKTLSQDAVIWVQAHGLQRYQND